MGATVAHTASAALQSCPAPLRVYDQIVLGHGSGGRLSSDLLKRVFLPAFQNDVLSALEDQATLAIPGVSRIAITTDTFVVQPIFFPGGDIGRLAIHGTINDLAVGGATPRFLSAAFVLEEGLRIDDLERIVHSMRAACDDAGVLLVAGDTKVVSRGKGDQIFITTTGIGSVPDACTLSIANARPGDAVLLSGTIGDHGVAIMSVREGLEFETPLQSDTAALTPLIRALLDSGVHVRCMRDPTRGGVSSTLHEIADASHVGVQIVETAIPVRPEVRGACELLGLDPLYVANEGKVIAIVAAADAERALDALRSVPLGRDAARIGTVVTDHVGMVTLRSAIGGTRIVSLLSGEQLPRIC